MRTTILLVVFLCVVMSEARAASTPFDEIADTILHTIWQFHPVDASYLGLTEYDTLLPDYSKKSLRIMTTRCHELNTRLSKIDTTHLSRDDKIDLQLLKIYINKELFVLEQTHAYEHDPLVYVQECVYGVYTLMRPPPSAERISALKKRLDQIPDVLNEAMVNLKHPAHILCRMSIAQLSEGQTLIDDVFAAHKSSMSALQRSELQKSKNRAIAAMERFALWLEKHDDKSASFALGRAHYEYLLSRIHLIDIDAEHLLELGNHFFDSLTALIDSLTQIYERPPAAKVTISPDFGQDDVIAYREREIEQVREFVTQHALVTVPEWIGDIVVVETPAFLLGIIPGIAMQPPAPFDTSGTSLFYTQPIPESFDQGATEYYYNYVYNRWFRSGVVHEAYPGHHLQLSLARSHPSNVRRSFHDFFFIEGWALYCEELMARSGLFEDTLGAVINMLNGLRFRAARVIVDVKLQTGEFTYDEALDFMTEHFARDRDFLAKEVTRYVVSPGQPSSYLLGKLQILQLLDDYRAQKGEAFELRQFHDDLLSHGSIPVSLVRRLMLEP